MAANVFGNPVTKSTLEAMAEYEGKEITQLDLVGEAYRLKNAEKKNADEARAYLDSLQADFGPGLSTRCLLYNATGSTINFSNSHDYLGCLWNCQYPTEVGNGQWGAFFHINKLGEYKGSSGAVVYSVTGANGNSHECLASWFSAWGPRYNDRCYSAIANDKFLYSDTFWNRIERAMGISGDREVAVQAHDIKASVTIVGSGDTSELEIVLGNIIN